MSWWRFRHRVWWVCLALSGVACISAPGMAASRPSAEAPGGNIVITAVSRDASVLSGGISTGVRTVDGVANVEQIAWLTPSGEWLDLPCNYHWVTDADIARCRAFAASYLGHPHQYTIVSADGYGATVESSPSRVSDCYSIASQGTYSGQTLHRTALAASDPSAFEPGHPLTPLGGDNYQQTLTAFAAAAPVHLATLAGVRLYRVAWGGRELIVVERSFTDFSGSSPSVVPNVKLLFAIGEMADGHFRMLFWKRDTEDDNEQILGTIVLKDGKEFLITSVNSSEAQFFHVYAMHDGSVWMVFSGGGSSC